MEMTQNGNSVSGGVYVAAVGVDGNDGEGYVFCSRPAYTQLGDLLKGPFGGLYFFGGLSAMNWVAVFVDAGYLFAQGSAELCGRKLTRVEITLDHIAVIEKLKAFAETRSKLPLLRVYWYDGASQGPTPQHNTLAGLADVKVRLGLVNSIGQQKGVDSLIITDMLTLARNQAMMECVLLSGDEDLRVGVQLAQEYGVRVHLLGIKPARGSQSILLLQEADGTYEWEASDLRDFLTCIPHRTAAGPLQVAPTPDLGDAGDVSDVLNAVAQQVALEVPIGDVASLAETVRGTHMRPRQIDARLLVDARSALGSDLDSSQKNILRKAFLPALEARLTAGESGEE